jgi:hypothetical protein
LAIYCANQGAGEANGKGASNPAHWANEKKVRRRPSRGSDFQPSSRILQGLPRKTPGRSHPLRIHVHRHTIRENEARSSR